MEYQQVPDQPETICVEVVYALSGRQAVFSVELPVGASLIRAVECSGVLREFPEIDWNRNKVGIFSRLARLDSLLCDRDRVEIYRPLLADPKEARRQRALAGKTARKQGKDPDLPTRS